MVSSSPPEASLLASPRKRISVSEPLRANTGSTDSISASPSRMKLTPIAMRSPGEKVLALSGNDDLLPSGERGQLLLVQFEGGRGGILLQVRHRRGAWDGEHHRGAPQKPG